MQTPTRLMTYDEYLELPRLEQRTEFVDGRIVELNPPSRRHSDIADALHFLLRQHIAQQALPYICRESSAEVEVHYDGAKRRGRKPDLFVCTKDQWAAIEPGASAVGSGTVESTIKQIAARVKITGALWKRENVPRMLRLHCAFLNNDPCLSISA